jgi:hypothetical protein
MALTLKGQWSYIPERQNKSHRSSAESSEPSKHSSRTQPISAGLTLGTHLSSSRSAVRVTGEFFLSLTH